MFKSTLIALLSFFGASVALADSGIHYGKSSTQIKVTNDVLGKKMDFQLDIPIYETKEFIRDENATCQSLRCRLSGNGVNGDWFGAFSGPVSKRAKALAEAIAGLDEREAQKVVELGYFMQMPRSWMDFENEIKNAKSDYFFRGGDLDFSFNVLDRYGYKNAMNLGYYSEDGCTVAEARSCLAPVRVKEEKKIGEVPRRFEFKARDFILLQFESDEFTIEAGYEIDDVAVSAPKSHNKYSIEANYSFNEKRTMIDVTGTERILTSLPTGIVKDITFNKNGDGEAQITAVLDERFIRLPGDSNQAQLEIAYKFEKQGWKNDVAYESSGNRVASPIFTATFPTTNVQAGKKYLVTVYVRIVGSKYYNSNYSQAGTSRSIKF